MSHVEREKLRIAIEAYDAAVAAGEKAKETQAKAEGFVSDLEKQIETFEALDKEIAASWAEGIERAIAAGDVPTFEAAPALSAELIKKHDAENKLKAARQAVSSLAEKLAATAEVIARRDLEREWAAEAVIAAEAHEAAVAFNEKLDELRRDFYRLNAIRNQFVRIDPATKPAPLYPGQLVPTMRPVELSADVSRALEEVGVLGRYEERHGLAMGVEIAASVEGYFKALRLNSGAASEGAHS